jgi:hypothetical protein
MSRWQSIKTAPKDGTKIIGFWPSFREGHQIEITYFVNTEHRDYGKTTFTAQYWFTSVMQFGGEHPAPSHWMPLPKPPKRKMLGHS